MLQVSWPAQRPNYNPRTKESVNVIINGRRPIANPNSSGRGTGFARRLPGKRYERQKSILPPISIRRASSSLVGRSHVVLPGVGLNVVLSETIAALLVRL